MITVHEADKIIQDNLKKYTVVDVAFKSAFGRILREDIRADRDYPPFNKALMDGIAVKTKEYLAKIRKFDILGTVAAGEAPGVFKKENSCVEIMTGAVVPKEYDCVIPIEEVTLENKTAFLKDGLDLKPFQSIRQKGADIKKNVILLSCGCRLNSANLAAAASVGKASLKVSYQPKVAVVSTGDEIVPIDTPDVPFYQTRQSNSHFIDCALRETGLFEVTAFHLKDSKKILMKQIGALLERFDVLIFTGGVSMGKFDFIPSVLEELGIQILFHKVKQKPGKPLLFGKNKKGQVVFALPGNPVSTYVGTYRYVIAHLKKALGAQEPKEYAQLTHDYEVKTDFTYFLPVKLKCTAKAQLEGVSVASGGSGDFASIAKSDGFMEIPANTFKIKEGFVGQIYRWG